LLPHVFICGEGGRNNKLRLPQFQSGVSRVCLVDGFWLSICSLKVSLFLVV